MRGKILTVLGILLILFSGACEKVVDIDLQQEETKLVIDAEFCDILENHTVRISRSRSLTDTSQFSGVSGAQVEIRSSTGQTYKFNATGPGIYRSSRLRGNPGMAYTLKVQFDGKVYEASSTMPRSVKPDSISFKKLSFPGDDKVYPAINYKDPSDLRNYYRILLRINSVFTGSMVAEDRFNNGNNVSELIFYEGAKLKTGDKLEVELICIDPNVYKYFFSLSQMNGNGGPPIAPDNPVSNITNGAFGIFSAQSRSTIQASIQ